MTRPRSLLRSAIWQVADDDLALYVRKRLERVRTELTAKRPRIDRVQKLFLQDGAQLHRRDPDLCDVWAEGSWLLVNLPPEERVARVDELLAEIKPAADDRAKAPPPTKVRPSYTPPVPAVRKMTPAEVEAYLEARRAKAERIANHVAEKARARAAVPWGEPVPKSLWAWSRG